MLHVFYDCEWSMLRWVRYYFMDLACFQIVTMNFLFYMYKCFAWQITLIPCVFLYKGKHGIAVHQFKALAHTFLCRNLILESLCFNDCSSPNDNEMKMELNWLIIKGSIWPNSTENGRRILFRLFQLNSFDHVGCRQFFKLKKYIYVLLAYFPE